MRTILALFGMMLVTAPATLAQLGAVVSDPEPVNSAAASDGDLTDWFPSLDTGGQTWIAVWTSGLDIVVSRSTDIGRTERVNDFETLPVGI